MNQEHIQEKLNLLHRAKIQFHQNRATLALEMHSPKLLAQPVSGMRKVAAAFAEMQAAAMELESAMRAYEAAYESISTLHSPTQAPR